MPVNTVQLTGNMLVPEVRQTKTGKTVAKAQMVVKTYGEDTDDMWVEVEAWENLANNLVSSFPNDRKTMRVLVEGTLKKDVWDDANTGQKRSRYFVSANNIAVALDYQTTGNVAYAGDNESSGNNNQMAQHSSQTQPVPRPMEDLTPQDAPF
jgi:single-stranded DNA-binding protein